MGKRWMLAHSPCRPWASCFLFPDRDGNLNLKLSKTSNTLTQVLYKKAEDTCEFSENNSKIQEYRRCDHFPHISLPKNCIDVVVSNGVYLFLVRGKVGKGMLRTTFPFLMSSTQVKLCWWTDITSARGQIPSLDHYIGRTKRLHRSGLSRTNGPAGPLWFPTVRAPW